MTGETVRPDGGQPAALPGGPGPGPVIDLGAAGQEPDPGRGGGPRRDRRSWNAALIVALALALVGGAAPPSGFTTPQRYAELDAGTAQDMVIVGNVLLLAGVTSPDSALYRIGPHSRLVTGGQVGLIAASGDLAVVTQQCVDGRRVIAGLDTRTGARRWQRTGEWIAAFGRYLVQRPDNGGPCPALARSPVVFAPGGTLANPAATRPAARPATQPAAARPAATQPAATQPAAVRPAATQPAATRPAAPAGPRPADVVDTATGRTLWTLPDVGDVPPAPASAASGRAALVGIDGSGRWIHRDLRSGAVLAGNGAAVPVAPLPPVDPDTWAPGDAPLFRQQVVSALPGVVTVNTFEVGRGVLQAFDPQTLRPLWTTQLEPSPYLPVPSACGNLICLDDGVQTTAVRAGTGAVAWRAPWHIVTLVGSRWAVVSESGYEPPLASDLHVVDLAEAGRTIADLPGWHPVREGLTVLGGTASGAALVYRNSQGRTWIATVDPGTGEPGAVVRMAIPGLYTACARGDANLVACRTGQVAAVWRVPT